MIGAAGKPSTRRGRRARPLSSGAPQACGGPPMRLRLTRRDESGLVYSREARVLRQAFRNPSRVALDAGPAPGVAAARQPQAIFRDAVGVGPARCDHPHNAVRAIPAQRDTDDSLGLGRQPLPQDSVEVARTPSGVPEAPRAANPTSSAQAPVPGRVFSRGILSRLAGRWPDPHRR
jgi:hypothetical protein